MRNPAALVGLLVTLTFIGWCLKPDSPAPSPVIAPDPGLISTAALADLDLPLPPGAAPQGRITRHQTGHGETVAALLTAPQPVAEIATFYRAQLPEAHRQRLADSQQREIVLFTAHEQGERLSLRLEPAESGSRIFVVRSRQP